MRILIADDDKLVCDLLSQFVRFCEHEVVARVSGGGLAVIQSFARLQPGGVLLDVLMPRFNGLTVCHALKSRQPDAQIILMSGMVDEHHPFVAAGGAVAFLHKPMHIDELREALEALERPVAENVTPFIDPAQEESEL